jgi:hypothetical protein
MAAKQCSVSETVIIVNTVWQLVPLFTKMQSNCDCSLYDAAGDPANGIAKSTLVCRPPYAGMLDSSSSKFFTASTHNPHLHVAQEKRHTRQPLFLSTCAVTASYYPIAPDWSLVGNQVRCSRA